MALSYPRKQTKSGREGKENLAENRREEKHV